MASEDNCSLQDFYLSGPSTIHTDTGLSHVILTGLDGVQQLMTGFGQKVNDAFSGGDPLVGEWFLVRETYLPFLLSGCYVLFCTLVGPALMRNRKPFQLRGPMVAFNFAIVACYIRCLLIAMIYLPMVTWHEFCIGGTVKEGEISYTLASYGWVVYILKYVEYFDTVFFVLRKKTNQMSFLHIIHHTLVPLMGWVLLRTETNGIQTIPVIINGIVHVIMYTYYGLAAMGSEVQKYLWWKKYLTQLQMAQFLIIFVFVTVVTPLLGCTMLMVGNSIILASISVFLYLFHQFYQATFQGKKDIIHHSPHHVHHSSSSSFTRKVLNSELKVRSREPT